MNRKVSDTESLYLSISETVGSFAIIRAVRGNFVTEDRDVHSVEQAWNQASFMHPHFRQVLLHRRWVDPGERHLLALTICPEELDLLKLPHLTPLNCGVSAIRLWVFRDGFVFQASHALTDGMGLQRLILAFFQCLRLSENGKLQRAQTTADAGNHQIWAQEREMAIACGAEPRGFMPRWDKKFQWQRPKNAGGAQGNVKWACKQIALNDILRGDDPKWLLAKVVVTLARWMQEIHPNDTVRCMLPVDLRKYLPNPNVDGNASLPLWLLLKGDEPVQTVAEDIRARIKAGEPLQHATRFPLTQRWQQQCRNWAFKQLQNWSFHRGTYALNAIVSFLGHCDIGAHSSNHFQCDSVWSSALFSGICPLQLHVTHDTQHVQIHLSYQQHLFTEVQVDAFLLNLGGCKNP